MWNFLCEPKKFACQKCPWQDNTCRKAFVCDWCGGPANLFYPSPDPFTPEVLDKIMSEVNNVEAISSFTPYGVGEPAKNFKASCDFDGVLSAINASIASVVGSRNPGEIQISDGSRDLIATCLETEIRGYGLPAVSTRPPIWGF